jgi:hypothetical protein
LKNAAYAAVYKTGGRFTMTDGSITNNVAVVGGGVGVMSGGRFDQTGGTVNDNTASQSVNIYMASGSLGSSSTGGR